MSRPQVSGDACVTRAGLVDLGRARLYVRPSNRLTTGTGVNWFGFNSIDRHGGGYGSSSYDSFRLFFVEVYVVADEDVMIRPRDIVLTTAQGSPRRPVSYLSPLGLYSRGNYALDLCRSDSRPRNEAHVPIMVKAGGSLCLALEYEGPPLPPMEAFHLVIGTLDGNGSNPRVCAMTFEPSRETHFTP